MLCGPNQKKIKKIKRQKVDDGSGIPPFSAPYSLIMEHFVTIKFPCLLNRVCNNNMYYFANQFALKTNENNKSVNSITIECFVASIALAKNSLSHMVNNLIIVLCIVIPNWRSIYREIGSSAMQQHD